MKQESKPLVILFGCTGRSGVHIANIMMAAGFPVRVVVRSKQKVSKIFHEKEIGFEKIIEGSLTSDQTLEEAFAPSTPFGAPKIVISSLGKSPGQGSTEEIQYKSQVRIIEKCKKHKVQKYIFITAALIERPWHVVSVILDIMVPDVFYWKAKAENYLRTSGIDYAIIRPTGLLGQENDTKLQDFQIAQGDKLFGQITRFTVAQIVYETCIAAEIPSKVTFEVSKARKKIEGDQFKSLRPDSEANIINKSYRLASRTYKSIVLGLVGWGAYYLYKSQFQSPEL